MYCRINHSLPAHCAGRLYRSVYKSSHLSDVLEQPCRCLADSLVRREKVEHCVLGQHPALELRREKPRLVIAEVALPVGAVILAERRQLRQRRLAALERREKLRDRRLRLVEIPLVPRYPLYVRHGGTYFASAGFFAR